MLILIAFVFIPLLKTIQTSLLLTDPVGSPVVFFWEENYGRVFDESSTVSMNLVCTTCPQRLLA
jgi:ABC-type sugar transport system permease subunit